MVGDGTSSAWKFNEVGEGTGTGVRRKTVTSREDGVTTLRMHIPWTDQASRATILRQISHFPF